jgi:hypothetical protein
MINRFVTCFTALLFVIYGRTQVVLYNDGTLKLTGSSDIVYITGGFTNTASASLTNNGNLYVEGHLVNNQAMTLPAAGSLYLNGTSAQQVSGTQTFKTYNLISNNNSGVTLNSDLSVSGVHTFTNGLLTTSSTPNYLIYQSGSSYTGSADSKHVNGWVKKIGSTNFTFPVGDATYVRPVALESLSGASEFDAKYNTPTPYLTQLLFPVRSVVPGEYWTINKISGVSANVHMNWDNSKVHFPGYVLAEIVACYYTAGKWTDQGGTAVGNVSTTGDITSNAQLLFGDFVIGSQLEPLPLEFISFNAKRKDDYTELKWVTIDELDTDNFKVERSDKGNDFDTLASIPTRSNGNVTEYVFRDVEPINGKAYYRIRCVDLDGTSKLTRIQVVFAQPQVSKKIQVINPVRNHLLTFYGFDDKYTSDYLLTDPAGKTIIRGAIRIQPGSNNNILLPDNLSKGIYFLKISSSGYEFRQSVLVE